MLKSRWVWPGATYYNSQYYFCCLFDHTLYATPTQMFHHSMALQAHQQEHQDSEPMDTLPQATPTSQGTARMEPPTANYSRQGNSINYSLVFLLIN